MERRSPRREIYGYVFEMVGWMVRGELYAVQVRDGSALYKQIAEWIK